MPSGILYMYIFFSGCQVRRKLATFRLFISGCPYFFPSGLIDQTLAKHELPGSKKTAPSKQAPDENIRYLIVQEFREASGCAERHGIKSVQRGQRSGGVQTFYKRRREHAKRRKVVDTKRGERVAKIPPVRSQNHEATQAERKGKRTQSPFECRFPGFAIRRSEQPQQLWSGQRTKDDPG